MSFSGASFSWYRDFFVVVWRWPKSPFWHQDLFFGIEILHSVVHRLDRLLPMFFRGSNSEAHGQTL